ILHPSLPPTSRIKALLVYSRALMQSDKVEKALAVAQEVLILCREMNHVHDMIICLNIIGGIYTRTNDFELALETHEQALSLSKKVNTRYGISTSFHGIGGVHWYRGKHDEALQAFNESLKINREIGDRKANASILYNLGHIYQLRGEFEKALIALREALKVNKELASIQGLTLTYNVIGFVYKDIGEYERSLQSYEKALSCAHETGSPRLIAFVLGGMGKLNWIRGDYTQALELLQEAITIRKEMNDYSMLAEGYCEVSLVYQSLNRSREAAEALEASLQLAEAHGIKEIIGHSLAIRARATMIQRPSRARHDAERSLQIWRELKNPCEEKAVHATLGLLDARDGNLEAARVKINQAKKIIKPGGNINLYLQVLEDDITLLIMEGDVIQVEKRGQEAADIAASRGAYTALSRIKLLQKKIQSLSAPGSTNGVHNDPDR
ncbi:tetratricopeptide repeat protein, partial [candidate division CSSED10-310 bacterium]